MLLFFFFFFKQKTAYEMVRSDWSSDVCSSDLPGPASSHLLSLVGRRDDSRRSVRRSRHPHETRKSHLSDQPAHPNRAFRSPEGVRKHWSWFFENVPDFQAELVRTAIRGDTEWAEWRWHGTQRDGRPFDVRGVVITGVRNGRVMWARLYMEPVESVSADHYRTIAADTGV